MQIISVIVPVYKVEPYFHRCIDSILNQTFTDFELILVDDGSPDNCGAICDEYAAKDNRIVVIHKENGGLSDARNAGLDWAFANSDSEWITFIDSDDWVHRQYLEILYRLCADNNVIVSSCGHLRTAGEIAETQDVSDYEPIIGAVQTLSQMGLKYSEFNTSVAWGRMYKKELFRNIRFPVGRFHEDEFVTYKLLFVCDKIAITTFHMYYYYINDSGITATKMSLKRMIDQLDALEEQYQYYFENRSQMQFSRAFEYYCYLAEKYAIEYSDDISFKTELKNRKKSIKLFIKRYREQLPMALKKYGYNKWSSGEYRRIENFQNDIRTVKDERGVVFALFWALKAKIFNKI